MRAKLRDSYGGCQAEVSVLRQQQSDLNEGKTKLEGLLNKLDQEQVRDVPCVLVGLLVWGW